MARRTVLVAVFIALATAPAGAAQPGLVLAQGPGSVGDRHCDSPGQAAITLEADSANEPTDRWKVQAVVTSGCGEVVVSCSGTGTLADIVTVSGCLPDVTMIGTFDPVAVCIPGPAREFEPLLRGSADVDFDSILHWFRGRLPAAFMGTAAQEAAALNVCV